MPRNSSYEPLLRGISQYDVDFVIPREGVDIPLGIDPFLLFKSRDPEYRELHGLVLNVFNAGVASVRAGDIAVARSILTFPEVPEIGLGYTQGGRRGSGVGTRLTDLIIETLSGSPQLVERGVRHIEEMQLLSAGIGPDRISDIVANILKRFLISYTQRHCKIWGVPTNTGVAIFLTRLQPSDRHTGRFTRRASDKRDGWQADSSWSLGEWCGPFRGSTMTISSAVSSVPYLAAKREAVKKTARPDGRQTGGNRPQERSKTKIRGGNRYAR